MKSSDSLFQLIQALTRNEKGYFKKMAGMHVIGEQNNYVRLFDAIEGQEEYDEVDIVRQFEGETFIRHLPSEKNYLYSLIIRSLTEYHAGISTEAELFGMLHAVEILFDKGLFPACDKMLRKAEKIAMAYEKHLILLRIHDWQSKVYIALSDMERLKEHLDNKLLAQEKLIMEYDHYIQYKTLDEKLFYYSKTIGFPRNKKDKLVYQVLVNHPLMRHEKIASGFLARYFFFSAWNIYAEVLGDKKATYKYRKKMVEHVEQFPDQLKDNLILYVRALNNLVNIQDELGYFEEMEKDLLKFDSIKTKSTTIQSRVFAYSYSLKIARTIEAGEFRECVKFFPEVEEGMRKFKQLLHKEFILAFNYNFFYGYFGAGDFRNSLKWMNKMLNDTTFATRPEIYRFALVMNLILHFELKNEELLAYNIRSTYRFLLKQKKLFRFEAAVLGFIRNSGKFDSPKEMKKGFMALKTHVEKLQKDPFEGQILIFFDIISWLESKITKRSFAEIIKAKALENRVLK
jgi:hypothetical protein